MQTKEQHRVYMTMWSKKNSYSVSQSQKRITINRKQLILDAKNKPCHDCQGWFNTWQMQFDHVNGDKRFNLGGSYTRSIKDLKEEIAKCQVVCANCHADRTYKLKWAKAQKEGTPQ